MVCCNHGHWNRWDTLGLHPFPSSLVVLPIHTFLCAYCGHISRIFRCIAAQIHHLAGDMDRHDSRPEQFIIPGLLSDGIGDVNPTMDSYLRSSMG